MSGIMPYHLYRLTSLLRVATELTQIINSSDPFNLQDFYDDIIVLFKGDYALGSPAFAFACKDIIDVW